MLHRPSVLLLLISAPFLFAAGSNKRLELIDIFQLETASEPQISPDGKRIVYTRHFADIMKDARPSNLWIVNFDGTGHRPLTSGNVNESAPRWSPDGSQLAFISDRDGSPQIYRLFLDNGQIVKLTNLTETPAGIEWSPDGHWLSFTMHVAEEGRKIAIMPTPPPGAKWSDPPKIIDHLMYRFNGVGYLKPGYTQLFVVPSEGGTPRQISTGNFQHGGIAFRASTAVWTPDGKSLMMSANRHEDFELYPVNTEIYEFSVPDGTVKALTSRYGPDNGPVVSPDGKYVAYTGYDDTHQGYSVSKLYVMNRDGSGSHKASPTWDRDVAEPRWAADGKGLYFLSDSNGNTGFYYTTLDGVVKKLAGNVGSSLSAYAGGGYFSLASNGNFVTTYARPDVPGYVAVGTLANPTLKPITAVNDDLLGARQLGQVEEIWYESSKDKRKLQGWIIKPPGFDPAKKYPLVLEIHGGPFANYGDRFDIEKQLMAARGYVVFYSNPRGSTSYGQEFGNLIHHAYPGDDFYDLNSGVDAVIAKGYVDPARLYVTGGSGGGVLTCWMIGHTTRFRAAVTVYPVINWYSFVLTSDIGNWTALNWFPGLPWDHAEHYEKRSLLSVVKNVKTPTMVLTGESDYRTPMSDSEQYYQALKLLGVESVLVRVPDEPHGIQVHPSHHLAKVATIIAWFDQHK